MFSNHNWESSNFTFQAWHPDEVWCSLEAPDHFLAPMARQFVWEQAEHRIKAEFTLCAEDGWEPVEPLGPERIKLTRSAQIDRGIGPADVVLWIMTCGVAFVLQVLVDTPRRYITYRPVEVRLPVRRLVPVEEAAGLSSQ